MNEVGITVHLQQANWLEKIVLVIFLALFGTHQTRHTGLNTDKIVTLAVGICFVIKAFNCAVW